MTRQEFIEKVNQFAGKSVPANILFDKKHNKKVSWVGSYIFGEHKVSWENWWNNKTSISIIEYSKLKDKLNNHDLVEFFFYDVDSGTLCLSCTDTMQNAIDLCGGLGTYLNLGE